MIIGWPNQRLSSLTPIVVLAYSLHNAWVTVFTSCHTTKLFLKIVENVRLKRRPFPDVRSEPVSLEYIITCWASGRWWRALRRWNVNTKSVGVFLELLFGLVFSQRHYRYFKFRFVLLVVAIESLIFRTINLDLLCFKYSSIRCKASTSRSPTMLNACPVWPARPVRPIRWT